MRDEKTKVECRLVTCGSDHANAKAIDDLAIPDPEPTVGAQIIKEATTKDTEDGNKSGNS